MKNDSEKTGQPENDTLYQTKSSSSSQGPSLDSPFGLGRTLSTEFMAQESALRALEQINGLFETRTWKPGEAIIQKGSQDRDLLFISRGTVEIWTTEETEEMLLNSIEAPYILGDVGFLSGLPRTATAKAKTEVKSFILKYKNFEKVFKGSPSWLSPVINSLVSGIKSLHYKVEELEESIAESRANKGS